MNRGFSALLPPSATAATVAFVGRPEELKPPFVRGSASGVRGFSGRRRVREHCGFVAAVKALPLASTGLFPATHTAGSGCALPHTNGKDTPFPARRARLG